MQELADRILNRFVHAGNDDAAAVSLAILNRFVHVHFDTKLWRYASAPRDEPASSSSVWSPERAAQAIEESLTP